MKQKEKILTAIIIICILMGAISVSISGYISNKPIPLTENEIAEYTAAATDVWENGLKTIDDKNNSFTVEILSNTKIRVKSNEAKKGCIDFDFSKDSLKKVERLARGQQIINAIVGVILGGAVGGYVGYIPKMLGKILKKRNK